jgi:peptidyl-prolyl cis-trans isomerase A (cyclophilin A)
MFHAFRAAFVTLTLAASTLAQPALDRALLLDPNSPELNERAPDVFRVRFETSRGDIVIEALRDWSPLGADRFYNLVRGGYFDESKFFRVRAATWVQFGLSGDPKVAQAWREATIADEPRKESNVRGTIAYAFAPGGLRATQMFINLKDNSATHDGEPFVPFGRVVEGIEAVDAIYAEYGDTAGGGIRGGQQAPLFEEGNAWLEKNFPKLDAIKRATIVEPTPPPTTGR